jgi:hypothetical protein
LTATVIDTGRKESAAWATFLLRPLLRLGNAAVLTNAVFLVAGSIGTQDSGARLKRMTDQTCTWYLVEFSPSTRSKDLYFGFIFIVILESMDAVH